MPKHFLRTLTLIAVLGLITACASAPRQTFPDVTFSHLPGIQMAVNKVEIEQRFVSSTTAPHAEHRVPLNPQSIMTRWPGDRIQQTGADATVKYIIVDASVLEHALDTDGNVTAIFTNEQALRYEVTAEAVLEVANNNGTAQGKVSARVSRSITVPENASLNERDKILFDLVASLMHDFDIEMENKVRAHLGIWLP
jgi:hypothetical protein